MNLFVTLDDIFGIALFVLVSIFFFLVYAYAAWKQWRCRHDGGVSETRACAAICRKCGKNLRFIGSIRKGETP